MALPNFIDKAAKAASHVLAGLDQSAFANELNSWTIGVVFDASAAAAAEGTVLLEMLVELLARLYPRLSIRTADRRAQSTVRSLQRLARSINPDIEFPPSGDISVCVVVGLTASTSVCPSFYAGSNGWIARFSPDTPQGLGKTRNPVGAAAAACVAAANVFRFLFAKRLPNAKPDATFSLSLLNYRRGKLGANLPLKRLDLGKTHLVGAGAIGSACLWTLSRMDLEGVLDVIDPEAVELTNLQRYVGSKQRSVKKSKVAHAKSMFSDMRLQVRGHSAPWDEYIAKRGDYRLERVAVALDSARDRLLVQGSLPRRILNAWTQVGDLAVTRHDFLGENACLGCLYLPTGKEPDEDELVARAIGLPNDRMKIRELLHSNAPLDAGFLNRIAAAKGVSPEVLLPFAGKPLRVFYQEAVCGSMILPAEEAGARGAEVPLAFQSALAGVMLAAEIVAEASGLRRQSLPTATRVNLMGPLGEYINFPEKKRQGCICQDTDFVAAYEAKYAAKV
jgi:hypothetical protein